MNSLYRWLHISPQSKKNEKLASRVGTTVDYLFHLARGYRKASADMAGRIEKETARLAQRSAVVLPAVRRADLCGACRKCPYAKGK